MKRRVRRPRSELGTLLSLLLASSHAVFALQVEPRASRFDALVVQNPTHSLDVATTPIASLPSTEHLREAWERFRAKHGPSRSVYLDRRSGAPLLVEGPGLPWPVGKDATVETIAASLRTLIAGNRALLLADDAELVLDGDASGALSEDVWQIVFGRRVSGVPVADERYVFTIGHGNLIAFGASRWSRIDADPHPDIDAFAALDRVAIYMGLTSWAGVTVVDGGTLQLIALRAKPTQGAQGGPYAGPLGSGYGSALVWRMALRVDGEPGTWEAWVDAHTGGILSFGDVNDYAAAKGGVYPVSGDGVVPGGLEQLNYPMPFTNISIGANQQTANSSGLFNCTPVGATATTTLSGPYVKVNDSCGAVSQSVSCDNDLSLGGSAGTNCAIPAGSSAGNTHAARSGFYHLNRISEHGRSWLPSQSWLSLQLNANVNLNFTCNAFWDGATVNFFRSNANCRNTGEISSVVLHEWGHGLDANDGGGMDRPSEAYADITAFVSTHSSCVGRGFRISGTCGGYGDACLTCTGIRDQDWDQRASHTPATPAGFVANWCTTLGSSPCGREPHCESHVSAEALWDLAVRDLPASGLDQASSWQLVDKLWYKSRLGSGGNAYNCLLPNSDGCGATTWFTKLRVIDDTDGNLANGTPHAAAIFAAFDRHEIACGAAGDASNQNSTTCPAIGGTVLTATAGTSSAQLLWTPAAGATSYRVLRNDLSCDAGFTIITTVPGTNFTDTSLANGFGRYYRIQPIHIGSGCEGPVSNCRPVTPQAFAGSVKLDALKYVCSSVIAITLTDANVGAPSATVTVTSAAEPAGETITLTQIGPGSTDYAGTIATTVGGPVADGMISVANENTITVTYLDADDGLGGVNVPRQATAAVDCAGPIITNVQAEDMTRDSARITWNTNEAATSVVHYGPTPPPGSTVAVPAPVVAHSVTLTGLAECASYVYAVESTDPLGNFAVENAGGAYYPFATRRNATQTWTSGDTPVPIPDNMLAGAFSTIVVPDVGLVQNVKVKVNLTHPFDGDLILALYSRDNAVFTLSNRRGAGGDNFVNTVFDDAAATPIAAGTAPFTGSFRPEVPFTVLIGSNAAGTWRLWVADLAERDSGTIDDWALSFVLPVACGGPEGARPVADGSFGTAMKGSRGDATGSTIDLTWDVTTCSSADHHIIYGDLGNVASIAVTGASCDLGTSGTASWTGVPAGDLWFVVVGDDNASTEGSWGTDGNGAQRGLGTASLQCGLSARDNSGVCP